MSQMPDAPDQSRKELPQSLLAQALASAANAVFITEISGKIIWVNDAFCRLTGYSAEEAVGPMCDFRAEAEADERAHVANEALVAAIAALDSEAGL